jgi:hypothetical protein
MLKRCVPTLMCLCVSAANLRAQQPLPAVSLNWNAEQPTDIQEFRSDEDPPTLLPSAHESPLPHGELNGWFGDRLIRFDVIRAPVQLPLAEYGGILGGSIHDHRTAYLLGFDQDTFSREKLLPGAAAQPSLLKSDSRQMFGRIDHRFSARDSVHARYIRSRVGGNGAKPNAPPLSIVEQNGTLANTTALSPSTVNETRGQITIGSARLPGGTPAYGVQSYLPTARRFRVYEAADNFNHQMGRALLRAGGDFVYDQMSVSFLQGNTGSATFSQSSRNAGFYALNQWKMSSDLVFTAGVRYDIEFLRAVQTDTNNLAPQVGFAWSPAGAKGTVIRGGYGITYEQLPLPAIAGALDAAGNVDLARAGHLSLGRNSLPVDALGNVNTVNPAMQNAYAEQANLQFEQQLGSRSLVSATYQHVRGVELAAPALGVARQDNSNSSSSYDEVTVALLQRPVQWGDYRVAYTYSSGQGSNAPAYGSLVGDQMRRAVFNGTLHTSLDAGSGLWQHLTHGFALSGYGDFTQRDELPGLDFFHLNAQLTKGFQLGNHTRLEFLAQTFSLFEHRNYSMAKAISELGESGGSMLATYGRLAAIGVPNGTQAGLRLQF